MISITTRGFRQALVDLPEPIREKARRAYRLFRQNPLHPGLAFKQVGPDIYSVRIGLGYRALGRLDGDSITWTWIGHHSHYDRRI